MLPEEEALVDKLIEMTRNLDITWIRRKEDARHVYHRDYSFLGDYQGLRLETSVEDPDDLAKVTEGECSSVSVQLVVSGHIPEPLVITQMSRAGGKTSALVEAVRRTIEAREESNDNLNQKRKVKKILQILS